MTSIQSLEPQIAHLEFRLSSGVVAGEGREGKGELCFRHWWQSLSGGKMGVVFPPLVAESKLRQHRYLKLKKMILCTQKL